MNVITQVQDQNNYKEYITKLQQKLNTSDEVIRSVVKEGIGLDFISKKRIIAGEVNEVYDLLLTNNTHVILRISHGEYNSFHQEKWALDEVKKIGVPVPEVLFITHKTIDKDNRQASFCLLEKINGEVLHLGNINFPQLPIKIRKKYIVQAGEILSKIHSIKTKGHGYLGQDGKTFYQTADEILDEFIERVNQPFKQRRTDINPIHRKLLYFYDKLYGTKEFRLFRKYISPKHTEQVIYILNEFRKNYIKMNVCLNHGDFAHKHFMIRNEKIVAILDWGSVRSDMPLYDFVYWDYWFGNSIPTDWLKEGYQNKELFDEQFDSYLQILRLMRGIETIWVYSQQQYSERVKNLSTQFLKDLHSVSI
ncbi:MAG TPA: aminoglycoside phosphotransferase family protein [Candidatus Woesebacteria bacterium]|nr:aminoglycoside phosphotransferase family protein [Candidatus Woesebacteria bacterium]